MTASFSIGLNGKPHGFFNGARGLRQGDPLSPYLFVLVMEILHLEFLQLIEQDMQFTYHWKCEPARVFQLGFADDLLLFCRADMDSVRVFKMGLDRFAEWSGLRLNIQKSHLILSRSAQDRREQMLAVLGFQEGHLPMRYLGLPLLSSRLSISDCQPLLSKIDARITGWEGISLSYAGRVQIIKSVLSTLSLYWASAFTLPKAVIKEVEKRLRTFLWKGTSMTGYAKVAWKDICKPVEEGGLGIKDIGVLNRALMTKKLCDVIRCDRTSIWVEWLQHGRLWNNSIWTVGEQGGSWSWRKMLRLRSSIQPMVELHIGDGRSFYLWKDSWHQLGPLLPRFPRGPILLGLEDSTKLSSVIDGGQWHWPLITDLECLQITYTLPQIHGGDDTIIWRFPEGQPTTQALYRLFGPPEPKVGWTSLLSGSLKIPRHSFILWMAIQKKLPTTDRPWLTHLGLRLPLSPYVAQILRRLEPFKCEWVLEKPTPVLDGGGLEGDQVNSLASFRYDPKKILVEEVLRLAHLSPAPIQVEGTLGSDSFHFADDMVSQARLTQRIRATQSRVAAGAEAPSQVASPSPTTARPTAENPPALEGPRNPPPIVIGSEETRSRGLPRDISHEVDSPYRSRTDESSPGGLVTRRRRRGKSPIGPNTRSRSQSLRIDQRFDPMVEGRNMEMLNDIATCWRKAREDLRTPNHPSAELKGEKFVPDWKVSSNSTVLGSQSGQETWELYHACYLPRDQVALLQTSFTRLEEHAAHSLIQAANFVRGLSLKCAGFRRNQLAAEYQSHDLRTKMLETSARVEDLECRRSVLEARVKELEEKMSLEISKATELGQEKRFAAGHAAGKIAGAMEDRAEYINSQDFSARLREARIQGARDFIKAPAFDTTLEIRAADYLVQGFERCKAQLSTLNGFAPGFNATRLDPGLDGNMQAFPDEETPSRAEDEVDVLLDEIENS
ncbi:UNVERIFIED_CONTAM: putative mitochondrial protein [Sesamum indicum]